MSEENAMKSMNCAPDAAGGAGVAGEAAVANAPLGGEVVIIGYGTAGVNAAIALRGAGYEGVIRAFSDTDLPPCSPILTSYYAGGEKSYEQCFPWSEALLDELHVELMANCPVLELDPAARVVRTAQGDFPYAKCLVAAGASPSLAGFPGLEGYEPLVLRTMADAERFKEVLSGGSCARVLVSGASMIALKSVEACLKRGVGVELVGMNEHVLDRSALPAAAERFERGLRDKGVSLRLGQTVKAVAWAKSADAAADAEAGAGSSAGAANASGRFEVTFSNGDVELFDEILVAHGVRSNLDFVPEGALETDRALVVDEFMRTSDAYVYAAGDVVQALELVSGEKQVLGIWKTAAVQGACAGAAIAAEMAGRAPAASAAYAGAISTNTIAVDGTLFISGGVTVAGEGCDVEVRETDDMTVVRVFEAQASSEGAGEAAAGRRLVGFNVACDKDEPGSVAYDTGAMLTLRIEAAFGK